MLQRGASLNPELKNLFALPAQTAVPKIFSMKLVVESNRKLLSNRQPNCFSAYLNKYLCTVMLLR